MGTMPKWIDSVFIAIEATALALMCWMKWNKRKRDGVLW